MTDTAMVPVHACPACGWKQVSPGRCQRCRAVVAPTQVPPVGEVMASTVIHRVPPDVLVEAPYAVASVRLDDGLEVVALSSAEARLSPGERVLLSVAQVRRDEEETWAFQAAPLERSRGAGR